MLLASCCKGWLVRKLALNIQTNKINTRAAKQLIGIGIFGIWVMILGLGI